MEAWNRWWYATMMMMVIILSFSLFAFRRKHRNRAAPLRWPVVGMLPGLLVNLHRVYDFATSLLRESGGTFMFRGPWLMGLDFLVTCDPANAKHMYNTHFANYVKGADFPDIFDVLGRGIITSDGEMWARQRKMAHAHMTGLNFPSRMAGNSRDKVEGAALPVLERLARLGGAFDLQDFLKRFSADLVGALVLGEDLGSLSHGFPRVPFLVALAEAEEVVLYRHAVPKAWWKLLRWLDVGEERKMRLARSVIDQFIAGCIEAKRRATARVEVEEEPKDLFTSYMYHFRDHKEEMISSTDASSPYFGSDNFLRDTFMSFVPAGADSPSTALAWFFWQLSKSLIVEKKIVGELREVVLRRPRRSGVEGQHGGRRATAVFDADETEGLVYLHAALCESLRLFPSIPFNHKMAVKEDVLPSGHRVRPGTTVIFSNYSMARIDKFWGDDCTEFKPERWIDPSSGKLKHVRSHDFLAFHTGPRSCLGKNVSLTIMKAIASAVIYNFRVEVVEGCVVEPRIAMVFQMKHGLQVRVTKREEEEEEGL